MTEDRAAEGRLDRYRDWHTLALPYFRWQFEQFAPWVGTRVADVGCGPGNLTTCMLDRELYVGIDQDPEMLTALQAEFGPRTNIDTLAADVTDPALARALLERTIDTVVCANLLEHVHDDGLALANLVAALPHGGRLCLLLPAHPALYGTLDTLDGHFRRYTTASVRALLGTQALRVHRLKYFNMVGAAGWLVAGRIRRVRSHQGSHYTVMNAVIPLMRRVENLVPAPFGLSVIAVAEKIS